MEPFSLYGGVLAHIIPLATHTCQSRKRLTGASTSSDTASKLGWKRNSRLSHSTNLSIRISSYRTSIHGTPLRTDWTNDEVGGGCPRDSHGSLMGKLVPQRHQAY